MVIDLPTWALIILLSSISSLSGCIGLIFGCCLRMAKKSDDKYCAIEQYSGISCNSCAGGDCNCIRCKMHGMYTAYKRMADLPEDNDEN